MVVPLAADTVRELLGPLYPEPAELIVGALSFGLLCWVLLRWVLPPVAHIAEIRELVIEGEFASAAQTRADADGVRQERDRVLADARSEARQIRGYAAALAYAERDRVLAGAVVERDRLLAEGGERLLREYEAVRRELLDVHVPRIAAELASRVLGEAVATPARSPGVAAAPVQVPAQKTESESADVH
ncbi:F0F1 ATP synthase subunit B [Longispora sp. NPDC051575]|uniref:F0F1 ATP synthase subunit B family protein n=1 Tax=Longispora sp. NPDC051575 TaxID=3154943 RepID=UPI00341E8FB4